MRAQRSDDRWQIFFEQVAPIPIGNHHGRCVGRASLVGWQRALRPKQIGESDRGYRDDRNERRSDEQWKVLDDPPENDQERFHRSGLLDDRAETDLPPELQPSRGTYEIHLRGQLFALSFDALCPQGPFFHSHLGFFEQVYALS